MTDGVLLAEIGPRPRPAGVRHDHHRRGPRAVAEHRLPARLPQAAAAAPARPQGRHHLGDDRPAALLRALRRRARARGLGPQLPRRGALPAGRRRGRSTRCRRSLQAVDELSDEGPGDVLVFLSGEREIRDTADALRGSVDERTEVVPLFARLSAAEQHRVFAPHSGRRIVLATNVAETSLTVPGIRYVVDPGTARISRYSQRTKVQRLPIEAISQASATQRAGRCGRVAPGICIRLYDEEDLLARPEFTDPEVLRTNLAVGHPADDGARARRRRGVPVRRAAGPAQRQGRPATCCVELGAIDPARSQRLHARLGRKLAQLPHRPAARAHGRGGRPATAACATCWSSPRRCRSRTRASGPRTGSSRPHELHARFVDETRTSWPTSTCGATCRSSRRSCPAAPSAGCARRSTSTTCASASGRTCTASCGAPCARLELSLDSVGDERRRDPPVAAGRAARPRRPARRREARVRRRPQRPLRARAVARRWPRRRRAG